MSGDAGLVCWHDVAMPADDPSRVPAATSPATSQMAIEIAQQPEAVARTLAHLRETKADLARLAGRRRVLLVARGSSDNAAIYGRYLLETHANHSAALAAPSVATLYDADLDLSDAIVVSVSQSGATEEIVEAQAWARRHGAAIVAVTNEAGSPLAAAADVALITQAGVERAVPATKTYTTQLTAMAVLASALAPDPAALDDALDRAADEIGRLIERRAGIDEAVERLAGPAEVMVSGRGLVFGTALEVALKLEETCLRPVRGLSYADLRHGPMAVVDAEHVAILVAAADGPVLPGMHDLADDVAARGAVTIGLGGDAVFAGKCAVAVAGPDLPETVAPLALVVPGQLIVEQLARRLGLDPDAPRGLNKITQTD
jgi:glutamine---fructose-6-phosphate transaminase (isomerizing)